MALGDNAGALQDARTASFLGDGKAVNLYGKLMRETSSYSDDGSSALNPFRSPQGSSAAPISPHSALLESLLNKSGSGGGGGGFPGFSPASLLMGSSNNKNNNNMCIYDVYGPCSCPHGRCFTFLAQCFVIAAWVTSVVSMTSCFYVYVRPIPEEGMPEMPREGFGWISRQVKVKEPPSYGKQCAFYSAEERGEYFDAMWNTGFAMSVLAVAIGLVVMSIVMCTCCVAFKLQTFDGLFWTSTICVVAQGLTFLSWGSQLCDEMECTWSAGTGTNMTAAMMWLWAANMIKSFPEALPPRKRRRRRDDENGYDDDEDDDGGGDVYLNTRNGSYRESSEDDYDHSGSYRERGSYGEEDEGGYYDEDGNWVADDNYYSDNNNNNNNNENEDLCGDGPDSLVHGDCRCCCCCCRRRRFRRRRRIPPPPILREKCVQAVAHERIRARYHPRCTLQADQEHDRVAGMVRSLDRVAVPNDLRLAVYDRPGGPGRCQPLVVDFLPHQWFVGRGIPPAGQGHVSENPQGAERPPGPARERRQDVWTGRQVLFPVSLERTKGRPGTLRTGNDGPALRPPVLRSGDAAQRNHRTGPDPVRVPPDLYPDTEVLERTRRTNETKRSETKRNETNLYHGQCCCYDCYYDS
mmetsp:Transcript_5312/g.11149  ORF Transcript_5312/g.11149 Transcript_5312/m.11149 type:complete len:635 (+) Transcript_5312:1093-2997(+)